MSLSTSTSTQTTTVSVNVRLVYQADQTGGQTEPPIHAGAMDALLNFAQQTPSPGTSQLLGRFEAIQESLERHVNAQAPADMPSSSIKHPLPLETARAAERRATSQDAGSRSGAGFMSPPIKIRRQNIDIQTLRALKVALTHDPHLDVTEWTQTNHIHTRTIRNYVYKGALTPEAQRRLDVADGKAPSFRPVTVDDLRNLDAALTLDRRLNITKWARVNRVHPRTIGQYIFKGALTPEAQHRLDMADGKAPSVRQATVDDLRNLDAALTLDRRLNVTEWARVNRVHPRTMTQYVSKGALTPEARHRLDVADGKALSFRRVTVDDVRNLDAALTLDRKLNVTEWARAHSLYSNRVRALVRQGKLRPEARERLQNADGQATVAQASAQAPGPRRVESGDLRALRDERASGGPFDRAEWAQRLDLYLPEVNKYVTAEGELTAKGLTLLNAG
ncbi:hypothetical protein [Pandoraea horticolens]|uniref:hypothetical protein n=1 Tax=Pandoraea horticolens TaxID=2508298 RepID=UPI0015831645|nr:hypothetical protein [Pandoraea horticolens]